MIRALCLATAMSQANAYLWSPFASPRYDLYTYYSQDYEQPAPSSSHWSVSRDAYELKVRLPDLEPTSVRAALGTDGTKIEVTGERKIEGCTCTPSVVKEISLPYRPRAEDIDVALDKDSVLSLKLARHAKTESATPIAVSVAPPPKEADDKQAVETRPLRFVPHESAKAESVKPTNVEEQEKNLTDKFRSAALAAVAVQHGHEEPSAKESAAATAEGAADAPGAATGTATAEGEGKAAAA